MACATAGTRPCNLLQTVCQLYIHSGQQVLLMIGEAGHHLAGTNAQPVWKQLNVLLAYVHDYGLAVVVKLE